MAVAGFSKHFLWGAATSAHQVEGDTHNQWTVWELENAKALAAQAMYQLDEFNNWPDIKSHATSPSNYVSGKLADHYHRYEEDFDLLTKLHMNAYRFSVEWSRIEPNEGEWDEAEIDHYKDYVRALKHRGIEPVITLFHFTLPVWFAEKGGFAKRSNVNYFVRFAEKIIGALGLSVQYIITVNEPDVYATSSYMTQAWPPAVAHRRIAAKVLNNLAYAHHQAAKHIHAMNRRYKVSFAKNSAFYYPGDDARLSRLSAEWLQWHNDDRVIHKFISSCDFLAVNYYSTNRVYGYRIHNPDQKVSDLHWDLQPADIEFVLERLHRKYELPLMITENGLADAQDTYRQWWLQETVAAMQRALKQGVPLLGYLHWSLIDNFEWAYGKWPCFGLAAVDYKTGSRTLRPSALWFGRVIKKLRGV